MLFSSDSGLFGFKTALYKKKPPKTAYSRGRTYFEKSNFGGGVEPPAPPPPPPDFDPDPVDPVVDS